MLAMLMTIVTAAHGGVLPCGGSAFAARFPAEADWRKTTTQSNQSGQVSATDPTRENKIANARRWMEDFILNHRGEYGVGDIPWMLFIPEAGTRYHALSSSYGLSGVITRLQFSGLGASGIVRGSFLLPVSGHNGNENARKWAKSDLYDLRVDTNPKNIPSTHSSWGATGNESPLVTGARSLDLVTIQEVEIQLVKDVPVVVLYDRRGSAGPSGYVEGRVMELIWDGT